MTSFKHNGKKIRYKARLITCDGKPIDQKTALENLKIFDKFMQEKQIPYALMYGTCLGAVRDKGFIPHDEDCDLGITYENFNTLLDNIEELLSRGFQIARYDERGQFSLWRNNEYIDVIAFKERDKDSYIACNMYIIPKKYLDKIKYIEFCDTKMPVSYDAEDFMLYQYGETWVTPIKYEQRSEGHFKAKLRAFIKLLLPKKLKFKVWAKTEKPMREESEALYKKYLLRKEKE